MKGLVLAVAALAASAWQAKADTAIGEMVDIERFLPSSGTGNCVAIGATTDVECLKGCQDLCKADETCKGVKYVPAESGGSAKCTKVEGGCSTSGSERLYTRDTVEDLACGSREYSMIFLMDESGSVRREQFDYMTRFAVDVTASLSHIPGKVLRNVSALKFSSYENYDSSRFYPQSMCEIEPKIMSLRHEGGWTNIEDALRKSLEIRKSPGMAGQKVIVVLLTDGAPTHYGASPNFFSGTTEAKRRAQLAATELLKVTDTELIYGRIIYAKKDLFEGMSNVYDFDISTWNLNLFVDKLLALVSSTVCVTASPTKSPTPEPTSDAPTPSPTKFPTHSPTRGPTTLAPSTCTVLDKGALSVEFPTTKPELAANWVASIGAGVDDKLWINNGKFAHSSSYLFNRGMQNLVGGFIAEFKIEIEPGELGLLDGFAFVMHRSPQGLSNIPVSLGPGLGYKKIPNSIAIAFDLCANRGAGDMCLEEFVSIEYNPYEAGTVPPSESLVFRSFLSRRAEMNVRIVYMEQASLLRVYENDVLLMEHFDFRVDQVIGGVNAYLGFTSANGPNAVAQAVTSWKVYTMPTVYELSEPIDLFPDAPPKELVADGSALLGFSIQLVDECKELIPFGGYSHLLKGKFVELPAPSGARRALQADAGSTRYTVGGSKPDVVDIIPVDNGNGTYTATMASSVSNVSYALYAAYGEDCDVTVTMVPVEGQSYMEAVVALNSTNPEKCFFSNVQSAINTIPPPVVPVADPATSDPNDTTGDDSNIAAIAAGGGGAAVFFVIAALLMVRYRRKWRDDKAFIEEGRIYNLDKDVLYADDANLGAVGGALLSSRQAILREKSQVPKQPKTAEIRRLEEERSQLQEMVRKEKVAMQMQSTGSVSTRNPSFGSSAQRKEFGGGEV